MRRYSGRDFSETEIKQIRQMIKDNPDYNRTELSRRVCTMLQWKKPDGGLKEMSCRVAMLRMAKDGIFHLPASRRANVVLRRIIFTNTTDPQPTITQPVDQLGTIMFRKVEKPDSSLWNEYIERYHYLGYKPLPGAQLRYFITVGHQIVALLGFGAVAWQTAPRDKFIGWTHNMRKQNLSLIVNNARFLILPWIQSKNLASKILAMSIRQVQADWWKYYKLRPVLMETFVDTERFSGTCYKAANWIYVGKTKGRGKLGPSGKQSVPIKDIWLYPLDSNFRFILTK